MPCPNRHGRKEIEFQSFSGPELVKYPKPGEEDSLAEPKVHDYKD